MIETYLQRFANLRTDKNRNRYPAFTFHRAPHKPFLLLSVMDLISSGLIAENFVEPSFELVDTFNLYWSRIMPAGSKTSMAYPYFFMKSEGFWHLAAKHEMKIDRNFRTPSMPWLRENFRGARLDDALFQVMCDSESRELLRAVLINTYFADEFHPVLYEQGVVNYKANEYSKILTRISEKILPFGKDPDKEQKIRDQGFRRAIINLYNHRCALCGIRMLTPEGHTVVEAAHVVPWSESRDDSPTNGMALCRLCHWSFDEGLMSVGQRYEVLVSQRVRLDQNMPGHILTLTDRTIFRPDQESFWPSQDNLKRHRDKTFMK
jgi:putative restriction endonuclease